MKNLIEEEAINIFERIINKQLKTFAHAVKNKGQKHSTYRTQIKQKKNLALRVNNCRRYKRTQIHTITPVYNKNYA